VKQGNRKREEEEEDGEKERPFAAKHFVIGVVVEHQIDVCAKKEGVTGIVEEIRLGR
jgi:hypothetical protein